MRWVGVFVLLLLSIDGAMAGGRTLEAGAYVIRHRLELPHVERWPASIGYFYVIECSTLGGQLLARHFRERLGAGDAALAFLLGYRHDTGLMWKEMVGVLEGAMCGGAAAEAITDSARDTFTLLERWHQAA